MHSSRYGIETPEWHEYVRKRLDYVGALNFIQLEPTERPSASLTELDPFSPGDDWIVPLYGRQPYLEDLIVPDAMRPPWWTYMDHMMPTFLDGFLGKSDQKTDHVADHEFSGRVSW